MQSAKNCKKSSRNSKRCSVFRNAAERVQQDVRFPHSLKGGERRAHKSRGEGPERPVRKGRAVQSAAHGDAKPFGENAGKLLRGDLLVRKGGDPAGVCRGIGSKAVDRGDRLRDRARDRYELARALAAARLHNERNLEECADLGIVELSAL